ncbi:hypothetical protein [Anoxybacteroides rupiense]|jgi:hypothetical protein|uniref:hypothetical protein n=1 Tax=Anoxybacteroides rupiense TaxID=311460 RepID=UPI001606E167|nr:hypothetical protein [Anoxybacillus rupiensis]MBB3908487.1 hypothetical protein [Anoxybacillus rupiensis]
MNNELKMKIAETMQKLEKAVFEKQLSLVFQHEKELAQLTSPEMSIEMLYDIAKENIGKGNLVIDTYLVPVFQEAGLIGGEK